MQATINHKLCIPNFKSKKVSLVLPLFSVDTVPLLQATPPSPSLWSTVYCELPDKSDSSLPFVLVSPLLRDMAFFESIDSNQRDRAANLGKFQFKFRNAISSELVFASSLFPRFSDSVHEAGRDSERKADDFERQGGVPQVERTIKFYFPEWRVEALRRLTHSLPSPSSSSSSTSSRATRSPRPLAVP